MRKNLRRSALTISFFISTAHFGLVTTPFIIRGDVTPDFSRESISSVVFILRLNPQNFSPNGTINPLMFKNLFPELNTNDSLLILEPLRLPLNAKQHPMLKGIVRLIISDTLQTSTIIRYLRNHPEVIWIENEPQRKTAVIDKPNAIHFSEIPILETDAPPNDPLLPAQWYLFAISALAAWDYTKGDSSVIISVVDIGIDLNHPDINGKIWSNWRELSGEEGIDDDDNGFVDDIYGWDFYDNDPDPRAENNDPHGTHVAGLAGAMTDNGYGIAGVGWKCQLMPLRAGTGTTILRGYEAIIYAAEMGAKVINLSWGGETPSNVERIAIEYAQQKGAIVVSAAGNLFGTGTPFPYYPAGYQSTIAVGALDSRDQRAFFSNYGYWVDVYAPGSDILSLFPNAQFGHLSGTSMATPLISGALALTWSRFPHWSPEQIKWQILTTGDSIVSSDTNGSMITVKKLNLARALWAEPISALIDSFWFDDTLWGNSNSRIVRDEVIALIIQATHYHSQPIDLTCEIIYSSPYLTITP
ncbi:MAG: S8 family serine peptidase, partial [bacterium]